MRRDSNLRVKTIMSAITIGQSFRAGNLRCWDGYEATECA